MNIIDKAAEAAVIGSMLMDENVPHLMREILSSGDFGLTENKIIFEGILEICPEGGVVDILRLREWLERRDRLDAIGGVEYLIRAAETIPTTANAEYYARIVKDYACRRRIASACQNAIGRCLSPDGMTAEDIRGSVIKSLGDIDDVIPDALTSIEAAFEGFEPGQMTGYTGTGFKAVDDVIIGYGAGQIIIVAGRPGMGKSSFMAESARRVAKFKKKSVLYFSMEMNAQDISVRLACAMAGIDLQYMLRGWVKDDEAIVAYNREKKDLQRLPIHFDCKTLTPYRLRNVITSAIRRNQCDVVFVDYLGLMRPDSGNTNLYEKISEISNSLKSVSLDTNTPIVVGCQLSRANEQRVDKRPSLSDLRDSGAIEQDADVVMFLHRPEYYHKTGDRDFHPEYCECIVAKNRRGPTKTIGLGFKDTYTMFYDWPDTRIENNDCF